MKLFVFLYKSLKLCFCAYFLILFSNFCIAQNTKEWYEYHSFLVHGLHINEYEKCDKLIHECPINEGNIFLDPICLNKTLNSNKNCKKVKQLLDKTGGDYNGLIVEKMGNFDLINILSIGDNKETYYIISPAGYLIKTVIDPVKFNADLRSRYPSEFNIITNFDKPLSQTSSNGRQTFAFVLSARDCMGCETVLCTNVKMSFEKSGKPISITVKENAHLCKR